MDVAEWLRGLGLEQYAPAFRTNDIDGEVLRRLTAG
jgi:SAM domain (Sterile alpha motif)